MRFFKSNQGFTLVQKITRYKSAEVAIGIRQHWQWLHFTVRLTRQEDHPGFYFDCEVCGFYIELNLFDGRHWNYGADRFMQEGESDNAFDEAL